MKKKKLGYILIVTIMLVGLLDQVRTYDMKSINEIELKQNEYQLFFDKIKETVSNGNMVYELPYMNYPENGRALNNMIDGKLFLGYLLTDGLRWSYGGIVGRDKGASMLYIDNGMSDLFIREIKSMGFNYVYIDRTGLDNDGYEVARFYDNLNVPSIKSDDGILLFYDISNYIPMVNDIAEPGQIKMEIVSKYSGTEWNVGNIETGYTGNADDRVPLEAIRIHLYNNTSYKGDIVCSGYIRNAGWTEYVGSYRNMGILDREKPLDAVRIKVTGELSRHYDIFYKVYLKDTGWTKWSSNDEECGKVGENTDIYAVQWRLVERNGDVRN